MEHTSGKTVIDGDKGMGLTKNKKCTETNVRIKSPSKLKKANTAIKDTDSNVQRKNLSKLKKFGTIGNVNLSPLELSQLKDIKMGKAGKDVFKTPEKKHKTILNSMRKSPVKKAMEEKVDKGELEHKDLKSCDTSDKLSPKRSGKKMKVTDKTKDDTSSQIPDVIISVSKNDVTKKQSSKIKEQGGIRGKEDRLAAKDSPKLGSKIKSSSSNTLKGKSRSPSNSPGPSRKKINLSDDKSVSGLQIPDLGSSTETSSKRNRSPNSKFKEDILNPFCDSDKKSTKKLPKTRSSPRSGSSSKSSSPSKQSTSSDDSSTTATSFCSTSSSSDTTPEKGFSPLNNSSAIKNLFPEEESDDQSSSSDTSEEDSDDDSEGVSEECAESPSFEGLEKCSMNVDGGSLGMWKTYKYKYSSAGSLKPSNTLSDLIAKVNNNIETPDHERNKIFGTVEVADASEEMSPSREVGPNEYNDSMDSDKTLTEFDDGPNSSAIVSQNTSSVSNECTEKKIDSKEENDASKHENSVERISDDSADNSSAQNDKQTKDGENGSNVEISEDSEMLTNEKDIVKEGTDFKDKPEEAPSQKEINIFDHFGLKLRKKTESNVNSQETGKCDNETDTLDQSKLETDDVICISDANVNDVVVISDEDSVTNSPVKKKKFICVNHIIEPKPIEILTNVERQVRDKRVAFLSEELEEYIDVHKENMGPLYRTSEEKSETSSSTKISPMLKDSSCSPDMDEVDGFMFVSFSSEAALKSHIEIERKVDWLNESTLKKISQLKVMKERQVDTGKRRVTDVKSVDEQKQNFRGLHMKYSKYRKMLKEEFENLTNTENTPEKSLLKSPEKTSDITKIKGWKNKYKSTDDLQDAALLNLSESGKLHWKTEDRLLRNLNPDDMKDIGLDLKKKRRKLVNYSNKRKSGPVKLQNKNDLYDDDDFDYLVDDDAITEKDVYNEDDDKPIPEKIPYSERYLSQFKYGARKLFVKKMRLDADDEKILKKLGTQKLNDKDIPMTQTNSRCTRGKQLVFSKITQAIAVAAVSAFDEKLLNKAKRLAETPKNTRSKRSLKDEHDGMDMSQFHEEPSYITDAYTSEPIRIKEEPLDDVDYLERDKVASMPVHTRDRRDKERKKSFDKCNQPGCRYGCICHLCKVSYSSEEKESENKPPCDKEYCKLGCICESIETKQMKEPNGHCRKPACMFDCRCPPKQPKPDIPKVGGRKKKKQRGMKKKVETDTNLQYDYNIKEEYLDETGQEDKEDDWEPPNKRKRGPSGNRFANLPKRESTYRLAKNLDAVSRKAMRVYESSEMYTEQRIRRRRSDPMGDYTVEDQFGDTTDTSSFHQEMGASQEKPRAKKGLGLSIPPHKLNPETGVFEISDDDDVSEIDTYQGTCARSIMYIGDYNRKKRNQPWSSNTVPSIIKRTMSTSSSSKPSKNEVIELPDSEEEAEREKCILRSRTTKKAVSQLTVSQRLGLAKKKEAQSGDTAKWKTQMVCLKAKKKSDDNSQDPQSEIKLLEIISNCHWENDRTNMLSKISHIISKDYQPNFITMWQSYVLQFLPKADKPAVIPPELQSKLPNSMFSIRVRVTQNISDIEQVENDAKEDGIEMEEDDEGLKNMSDEDRKKYCIKQQSKLIEKIKFAEKLRDLIKNEEVKGISPSKFSVSLEGIEKALKRYKTQLWKAYTGSSNKSLMQIKQAVQALKSTSSTKAGSQSDDIAMPSGCGMSTGTLSRLQSNQGLKLQNSSSVTNSGKAFISLGSLKPNSSLSGSNITIKSQDHPLGTMFPPGMNKPYQTTLPVTSAALPLNNKGNEVLLIPIQDSSGGKWDPAASPVFTAKVTMIPSGGVHTSVNNSVVNLTSIPSTGIRPTNVPVRMVMPPQGSISSKVTKPMLNPELTAYTHAPFLPGHRNQKSPVPPGNSQILFSSIQPISSGSAVFSQVQSMMTHRPPFNSGAGTSQKAMPPIGICRPQVPNSMPPGSVNVSGIIPPKCDIPSTVVGKPSNLNAFPPIRYAAPFTKGMSGPMNFRTSTNSKAQQVILLPVSSTSSMTSGASSGHTMIAVPLSNITPGELAVIPPTSKLVRMVSPQTVTKPSDDSKTSPVDSGVQKQDDCVPLKSDLSAMKESDSKLTEVKSTVDGVHNKHVTSEKGSEVIEIKNDASDDNGELESIAGSVQSGSTVGDSTVDKTAGEKPKFEMSTSDSVPIDCELDNEELKCTSGEASVVLSDKALLDEITQGKIVIDIDGADIDDIEGCTRKRKGDTEESDYGNTSKVSKKEGAFNIHKDKTSVNIESEDSDIDVDIVSLDHGVVEVKTLQQTNRRKSQQVSMAMDDFQIKSVKVYKQKKPEKPLDMKNSKLILERSRRYFVKHHRGLLAKTTFKYNQELREFSSAIPEHLVLSEARKLIRALKHKAARLQESLADGKQYQQSLRLELQRKIDGFVQTGVPETILKNFLKSVSKANPQPARKRGKDESDSQEESDTDLDYDKLSTADVMRNKNVSLERVLEAIGEEDSMKSEFNQGSDADQPLEAGDQTLLINKLESLDSGVYIDNAEGDIVDLSSDNADGPGRLFDVDSVSDDEIRSSTGDVMLENDLVDLDAEETADVVNTIGESLLEGCVGSNELKT